MDGTPPPQPAPHDVIYSPTTPHSTAVKELCLICYEFMISNDSYLSTEHSWGDITESAQACACCDVVVRGCRDWLDKDGKKDWTPASLILNFRRPYGANHGDIMPLKPMKTGKGTLRYEPGDEPAQDLFTGSHYVGMNFVSSTIWLAMFEVGGEKLCPRTRL